MGIDLTALIPYKGISPETLYAVEQIKADANGVFYQLFETLERKRAFPRAWEPQRYIPYWYDEVENVEAERIDLTIPMRYHLGQAGRAVFLQFGRNTIGLLGARMGYFCTDDQVQQAYLACIHEIGRQLGAIECYIAGDNHALYKAFKDHQGNFRKVSRLAKKLWEEEKATVKDIYVNLDESTYDIQGFYKLKIL